MRKVFLLVAVFAMMLPSMMSAADKDSGEVIAKEFILEDFDGLTWENGMLISPDEHFVRKVLGEHVCPKFMLNIMSTLPVPANDNEADKKGEK